MTIRFTIPGPPVGKGRARFAKRGKFMTSYTPEKTASYESLVKMAFHGEAALASDHVCIDGAVSIQIIAYFPIPKSMRKGDAALADREILRCTKKPDGDNILKIVCDALNKLAFNDDAQVSDSIVCKRYSPTPRVEVIITPVSANL